MSAVPYCDDYTCPYMNSEKCGDVDTLDVIQQFRKLYENKLREIDQQGCTDSVKLKLKVQQKWIEDLTEQTEMMARVVKELELEAAERVQLLEEKLKKSAECACEVMRRYQMYDFQFNSDDSFQRIACLENDIKNLLEFIRRIREDGKWSIDGLAFYDVDYQDLFGKDQQDCKCNSDVAPIDEGICRGEEEVSRDNQHEVIERLRKEIEYLRSIGNPEQLLESLRKKNAEHNELKQSMVDMRQALTEEVACKHDLILSLKKDIQQLEERCIQSDKQTAFKDDIIKELRKEIKQLKQQQPSLESIDKSECDCEAAIKELEENHRLEVIQLQQQINGLKKQLADNAKPHSTPRSGCHCGQTEKPQTDNTKLEKKKKEKVLGDEIEKRQFEIEQLKEKCRQLEKSLANSKEQSENLQKAVDLYLNSINVLEASEERCKLEIEQQRTTIINLQEALVNVKQELDEIKGRNQQDFNNQQQMVNIMYSKLIDVETIRDNLCTELSAITEAYKKAVDLNFDLEVEHFNSLQDITVLETHLIKYQNQLRDEERQCQCLNKDLKKAQLEKQDCEHLVSCLKKDISIMSKQLRNLQEILEISNKKCEEETQDLLNTVAKLQNKNQCLQRQLNDNEEKCLRENYEKTTIINELRSTIEQKTADLDVLSRTIDDLKERLSTKNQTNNDLQITIAGLNRTITELQTNQPNQNVYKELTDRIQILETRNQQKVNELLEEKDRLRKILDDAINELQTIRNTKAISLAELDIIKEQQRQQYESMKRKLQSVEDEKRKIEEELADMRRQCKRALEQLKESLTTINTGLIDGKFVKNPDYYYQNRSCECNLFESCLVEIAFTDRLLKDFKDEYKKLLNNSAVVDGHSNDLIEQLHAKDQQILQYRVELQKFNQQNGMCLCEYVKSLIAKVNVGKTTTDQDEIVMLKDQIKSIFQDQQNLQKENDKLLAQIDKLQAAISKHEDANRLFHVQYEANHAEIQHLLENNRLLEQQKDDINNELERAQNYCRSVEKKNRQFNEIIKNLEVELLQMKAKRDDICAESKNVVDCVRAWLSEQKKIDENQQRKPCCCKPNKHDSSTSSSIPNLRNKSSNRSTFVYDWSHNLGSQGTDSTGCPSPDSCSPDDLFTHNYKDDEDDESTDTEPDDEIVRRAEELTNQIRCSSRCVRGKFPKFFAPRHDN